MLPRILFAILIAFLLQEIQCAEKPPKVNDSYIAWGEITQPIKELAGAEMQIHFEETYDKDTQNAGFLVWLAGKNVTFVKNYETNETFRYTEGKECVATEETEWIKSDYPPGLMTYEDDDGTIKFSLRQLFNLPDNLLANDKKQGEKVLYRNIPAKKWVYQITGKDQKGYKKKLFIYAFWADNVDGKWNTSSNTNTVPLGFVVSKTMYSRTVTIEETVTNVYGFISGAYDHKFFQPFQGVICADREQTYKFPDISNIRAIALHSEMVLPDYQEMRYIDTWFDAQNQLQRVDVERIKLENPSEEIKTKRFESETAIGKMGVVYRQTYFQGQSSCEIIPLPKFEYDVQDLIDIKQDIKRWSMGKLFGLNQTNYVYTGKTTKADIPCHVFQGIRTDWPEKSANVTSLWEWCFNVNMSKNGELVKFRNNEFGLISAQVKIISSDKPMDFPVGFRFFHHFYQVTPVDPQLLDATTFDISGCYNYTQRRYLQFYLDWDINRDNRHIAENLTSDVTFLKWWKFAIYFGTGLQAYTLRVSAVRATIDDNKMYIRFLILGVHPDLPSELQSQQISAFKAETNFRDNVNAGKVSISYRLRKGENTTVLKAAKHSVTFQFNPDFETHTLPPLPTEKSTETTKYHFTLITDDDGSPSPKIIDKQNDKRHSPGTVAVVSIAMLLVGISIGGSGTFYKFYGLPACMRGQT